MRNVFQYFFRLVIPLMICIIPAFSFYILKATLERIGWLPSIFAHNWCYFSIVSIHSTFIIKKCFFSANTSGYRPSLLKCSTCRLACEFQFQIENHKAKYIWMFLVFRTMAVVAPGVAIHEPRVQQSLRRARISGPYRCCRDFGYYNYRKNQFQIPLTLNFSFRKIRVFGKEVYKSTKVSVEVKWEFIIFHATLFF